MAIEIRTFDGDPEELARFCVSCWRQAYEGTNMPFPLWNGEFMEWENFGPLHADRHFLVAAYDGGRLVGALPARPVPLQIDGEPVDATISSYFGVDPAYREQGVALKLNLEQRRRHRQRDTPFMLGYVYMGASAAKGKEFWLRQPKNVKVTAKLGLWARILDHRAVAKFERAAFDKWGARMLGIVQRAPKPLRHSNGIRPFQAADLADCQALAARIADGNELTYLWPAESLARQLDHAGVPRTLVAEEQGRVTGLINYCHLGLRHIDAHGDDQIKAAVIDLLSVRECSSSMARRLVRAALRQMHEEGCHVALILRTPCFPAARLLRHGFVAQPAAYALAVTEMGKRKAPQALRNVHVHWR